MADIKPYQITVPEAQLADLRDRLARTRFPDELEGAEWDLGAPLGDVQRLAKAWGESFDWRRAEAELNRFPQFTTEIQIDGFDALTVHFIHQKSEAAGAIPLLFVHGWPGSVYEATKIIEPLTEGGGDTPAFDVVVPSLPNFGFSDGVRQRGFSVDQHAACLHALMRRLGYDEYVTQGGDWGYFITRALSHYYPAHVKATHLNLTVLTAPPAFARHPLLALGHAVTPYSARERAGLARSRWFDTEGRGYYWLQATKPQTLGYGLADSPALVLAWVYEKLRDWTDAYPWTDDEVLTWVSLYWFSTAGPAASVRLYYEFQRAQVDAGSANMTQQQVEAWQPVKVGLGCFPKDLFVLPFSWARKLGNIVYEKHHPEGGHFAAWERPEAIIDDLRTMFGKKGGGLWGRHVKQALRTVLVIRVFKHERCSLSLFL